MTSLSPSSSTLAVNLILNSIWPFICHLSTHCPLSVCVLPSICWPAICVSVSTIRFALLFLREVAFLHNKSDKCVLQKNHLNTHINNNPVLQMSSRVMMEKAWCVITGHTVLTMFNKSDLTPPHYRQKYTLTRLTTRQRTTRHDNEHPLPPTPSNGFCIRGLLVCC